MFSEKNRKGQIQKNREEYLFDTYEEKLLRKTNFCCITKIRLVVFEEESDCCSVLAIALRFSYEER